ncbi:MAG: 50S ribosome-binding GTPase [Planctomycetes bacterium]|nr:50S ribosome-binding GTPase [Planctomycetota bacterium]
MQVNLATKLGLGGISVFEICGTEAELTTTDRLFKHHEIRNFAPAAGAVYFGEMVDADGKVIDEVIIAKPEEGKRLVTAHGGSATTTAIMECLQKSGCKKADGRISTLEGKNLIEREADELLPQCRTELQAAVLLTARQQLAERLRAICSTEKQERLAELERLVSGYSFASSLLKPRGICLAGSPNAGKSSIFNILLEQDRAMVSDAAGTTRDAVAEWIDLGGYHALLSDTAGIRETECAIESEAVRRSHSRLEDADLIALVFDGSRPLNDEDRQIAEKAHSLSARCAVMAIINKTDLPGAMDGNEISNMLPGAAVICVSCTGNARETNSSFTLAAVEGLGGKWDQTALPFTQRHHDLLQKAIIESKSDKDICHTIEEIVG